MPARKKASSKKVTRRKPAAAKKKSGTKKAGSRKAVKKKTAKAGRRKVAKKTAKKPAKKATKSKAATKPTKAAASKAKAPARRGGKAPAIRSKRGRRAKSRKQVALPSHLTGDGGDARRNKLGVKWNCYSCGAKFYDLNQPEPLCPKCGADQRERPAVPLKSPSPPKKKKSKPLAPYLDDDDGATRNESLTSEDLDLELDGRVSAEEDGATPDLDLDDSTIEEED